MGFVQEMGAQIGNKDEKPVIEIVQQEDDLRRYDFRQERPKTFKALQKF